MDLAVKPVGVSRRVSWLSDHPVVFNEERVFGALAGWGAKRRGAKLLNQTGNLRVELRQAGWALAHPILRSD
ncbi:hypothetical protein BOW52_01425 [Solemya elarraichensis gill symbiont]|uniref:Uncharacterized protein n=1 Tax=Solemya elarraichensis gill symbiont TaxID=1918949 RepID=A0A1T2LCI3_9GAMM|nr:hypothetical protein BOW52_01425 [Solemya elarraichensis gill symbiont]